jgi:hypothetical protein
VVGVCTHLAEVLMMSILGLRLLSVEVGANLNQGLLPPSQLHLLQEEPLLPPPLPLWLRKEGRAHTHQAMMFSITSKSKSNNRRC